MCKRNGNFKVVKSHLPLYPLKAGAFICDVHNDAEAKQREIELCEQLGLSGYERCSDCQRVLNVIKHRIQEMLGHISVRKQWKQLQKNSKKREHYYNQAALYLELLLLVCHRGPGLHHFDKLSQQVFAAAGTENTETLQSGIAHTMAA
jgi:hypothetical protein